MSATVTAKSRDTNIPDRVATVPDSLASGELAIMARDLAGLRSLSIQKGQVVQVYSPTLALLAEYELPEDETASSAQA